MRKYAILYGERNKIEVKPSKWREWRHKVMSKKNVLVLFGGRSSEHEVSCVSATTVISNMDREAYEIYAVGITKEGRWLLVDTVEEIQSGSWVNSKKQAVLSPDTTQKALYVTENGEYKKITIDVAFPVLHG